MRRRARRLSPIIVTVKRWRAGITLRVPLTSSGLYVSAGIPTSYEAALTVRITVGPVEASLYLGAWFPSEDGERALVGAGVYYTPGPVERLICRVIGHRVEHSAGYFTGSYPRWLWCSRCQAELENDPGPTDPRPGREQPNVELREAA